MPSDNAPYDPAPICGGCYNVRALSPARCAEKPERLKGKPIGMYHCPDCGAMVLAGLPHPDLCNDCQPKPNTTIDSESGPR